MGKKDPEAQDARTEADVGRAVRTRQPQGSRFIAADDD